MTGPHQASLSSTDPTDTAYRVDGLDAADTLAPSTVAHRYVLGEEIARGGMGVIYRATDTALPGAMMVPSFRRNYTTAVKNRDLALYIGIYNLQAARLLGTVVNGPTRIAAIIGLLPGVVGLFLPLKRPAGLARQRARFWTVCPQVV
jgi:hypothetical protein